MYRGECGLERGLVFVRLMLLLLWWRWMRRVGECGGVIVVVDDGDAGMSWWKVVVPLEIESEDWWDGLKLLWLRLLFSRSFLN